MGRGREMERGIEMESERGRWGERDGDVERGRWGERGRESEMWREREREI